MTLLIFLILIFGIIELGRFVFMYTSVAAAGREAARFASGVGYTNGVAQYNNCAEIRNRAKKIGWFAGVTDADVTIRYDTGPATTEVTYCNPSSTISNITRHYRIIVQVQVPYDTITGIVPIPEVMLTSKSARSILLQAQVP